MRLRVCERLTLGARTPLSALSVKRERLAADERGYRSAAEPQPNALAPQEQNLYSYSDHKTILAP